MLRICLARSRTDPFHLNFLHVICPDMNGIVWTPFHPFHSNILHLPVVSRDIIQRADCRSDKRFILGGDIDAHPPRVAGALRAVIEATTVAGACVRATVGGDEILLIGDGDPVEDEDGEEDCGGD